MEDKAGVPHKYLSCRLDNFESRKEYPKLVPFIRKRLAAMSLISGNKESTEERGFFFNGTVGTGKTHLAVGVLAEGISVGLHGFFTSVSQYLVSCQESWQLNHLYSKDPEEWEEHAPPPDSLSCLIENLDIPGCVVLDDLGMEKPTAFTRQVLDTVIEKIYNNSRTLLVVTSNLSLSELKKIYPRIADRMAESCTSVQLDMLSYRVMKAQRRMAAVAREIGYSSE